MFKKFALLAVVVAAMALPASAQWFGYTQYIQNGGFSTTSNWTWGGSAYLDTTSDDPCDIYYGYHINAAALFSPYDSVSQTFTVASSQSSFTMSLEVQAQSIAGATSWDEMKVYVEDLTNGQSEVFYVKGSQLTSTCQRFDFTPIKNYSGHQVRLTINSQAFTSLDWYVDNVAFWSHI